MIVSKQRFQQSFRTLAIVLFALNLAACQTAYYSAMEKVGIHKRDILIDRVTDTRDAQKDSQEQFKSALAQLSVLIEFDGGKLQEVYEALQDEYDTSLKAANEVSSKITKVDSVATALFDEWETELEQYENPRLKRESEKKLKATQRKFNKLLRSMRQAEKKMQPVLTALKDNTLYLKHNLNAQAIGAIKNEYSRIKANVGDLIKDMNAAIAESDAFIASMQ
jgi:ribosomal protein L22